MLLPNHARVARVMNPVLQEFHVASVLGSNRSHGAKSGPFCQHPWQGAHWLFFCVAQDPVEELRMVFGMDACAPAAKAVFLGVRKTSKVLGGPLPVDSVRSTRHLPFP